MKNIFLMLSCFLLYTGSVSGQDRVSNTSTPVKASSLLIRCDDIGMCHAMNMAVQKVIEAGIPFSASVMFACPWYQEAVEILKQHPDVSVGIHLTLNAEWKNYRWGPVAGRTAVPSLVDSNGYFFPSRKLFFAHKPLLPEIELELRAQIDRALASGLRIDYVDYHMGTAVDTEELRALVEKLSQEYRLGISRYFGETDVEGGYGAPSENKLDTILVHLGSIKTSETRLMVFHIGMDTPETAALIDLNDVGLKDMSKHRQAELNALISQKFMKEIAEKDIHLRTYHDLIQSIGLNAMKRPPKE